MKRLNSYTWSALALTLGMAAGCGGGGGGSGGGGGGGGPTLPTISGTNSSLSVDVPFGTPADGTSTVGVTVTVLDDNGDPVQGQRVVLTQTGVGGNLTQPVGLTAADGTITGALTSQIAGRLILRATINPGLNEVFVTQETSAEFLKLRASDRYVRVTGSDANAGTSPLTAWRTLAFALTQLQAGETLYVGAGTYGESLTFATSGTTGQPIILRADTAGCYTGDAGPVIIDAQGLTHALHLDGVEHVTVRGFTLTGALTAGAPGGALWLEDGNDLFVIDNEVYGNDLGIFVDGADRVVIEDNRISNQVGSTADGLVLANTDDSTVVCNVLYNNGRYGVRLQGAANLDFDLNTLYANVGNQLHESTTTNTGFIRNSVVTDGLSNGLRFAASTSMNRSANLIFGNAGFNVTVGDAGPEAHLGASADPEFTNPLGPDGLIGGAEGADDNFLVEPTSPTVDLGDSDAASMQMPFGGSLKTFSSRNDGILEGVAPDGATVNLGLHKAAELTAPTALDIADARLSFGVTGSAFLQTRSRTDQTWSANAESTLPAHSQLKWSVHAVSPLTSSEEIVAFLVDDGSTTELFLDTFDGRKWAERHPARSLRGVLPSANADQRGFDVVFEQASGEAMLAYSDGSSDPIFRIFTDGRWTTDAPVFVTSPFTGSVLWIELVARPGTDEIALVALDSDENLVATIWDGTSWEAGTVLDTQIITTTETQAFDTAFESLSGDLLVAYGHTHLVEETRFASRDALTGTWSVQQAHSTDAVGAVFRLAADPVSDRIAAGVGEGTFDDDVVGMIWDGDQWADIAEVDLDGAPDQRDLSVNWVGNSGQVVFLWRGSDGPGLDWATWRNGWQVPADATLPGSFGEPVFYQSAIVPGSVPLLLILATDETNSLYALTYDGAIWRAENSGQPVAVDLSLEDNSSAEPFGLAFRR